MAQSRLKTTKTENLIRSANAPVISAGVMMANMPWNMAKAMWGTVPARGAPSWPTPRKNAKSSPPTSPPGANDSE